MKKPEIEFKAALAKAYPGMGGEMRRGIVGLAIRCFITPVELSLARPMSDPVVAKHAARCRERS